LLGQRPPGAVQAALLGGELPLGALHLAGQLGRSLLPGGQQAAELLLAGGRCRGLLLSGDELALLGLEVGGERAGLAVCGFDLGLQRADVGGARAGGRQQRAGQHGADECGQALLGVSCLCRGAPRHEARETSELC